VTAGTLTRGRLREHPIWRNVLASEHLAARLIQPVIVSDAVEDRERVEGAGGLARISITEAVREARAAASAGIAGLLVFGASERKDENALIAIQRDHVVPRAVRAIKDALPDLAVVTDVCVCPYTTHGQCVLFSGGGADIEGTLERLAEIAGVHADAGADLILPSGMLDGGVGALRSALEAEHAGLPVAAMAKLESALYTTHRIALGAAPILERAVPLLDPSDRGAAEARVRRDIAAGADAVVVKPGVAAIDVVASLAVAVDVPVIAYHTADEHAIWSAETDADGVAAEHEVIASSRRAGAQIVITYGALAVE
jgi:porphobilinogen synthase